MAVDGHFHDQRRRQLVAQHRDDLADRRAARVRRGDQFADHQLAFACLADTVRGDLHIALDALVVGVDVSHAVLIEEAPQHARHATLEHARNGAFATAAAIDAGDIGERAVAMHDLAHFERWQEQIVAALVGFEETKPLRIGDDHAGDQAGLLHRRITAAAVLHQLCFAHHRSQALAQCVDAIAQIELLGNFFGGLRTVAGFQQLQDRLAAGDRLGIPKSLALGMRILEFGSRGRGGLEAFRRRRRRATLARMRSARRRRRGRRLWRGFGGVGCFVGSALVGGPGRCAGCGADQEVWHPARQLLLFGSAGIACAGGFAATRPIGIWGFFLCHCLHGTAWRGEMGSKAGATADDCCTETIDKPAGSLQNSRLTCPGGGIGRRTSFRC